MQIEQFYPKWVSSHSFYSFNVISTIMTWPQFPSAALLVKETVATSLEDNELVFVAFFDVAKAFDSVWVEGLFFQLWEIGIRGKTWRLLFRCYQYFWCCARVKGYVSAWYELKCGIHQGGYMSLIKYTAIINSLIVLLQNSGFCCSIRRVPSTPVGYADDLATCSLTERKLDGAMQIVYRHGCTWRYQFNAKKSGVMVFGETKRTNSFNSNLRRFKLGSKRVKERTTYDHVGVACCLYEEDMTGIENRLAKARRTLNAVSGMGIRVNGLTVSTCCIRFWAVVVPIALFGAELWIHNDQSIQLIEAFQVFAGKKIQRLYGRSPNSSSFFRLGWIRIERLVDIKEIILC